jgi:hypothetical protein
MIIIAYVGFQWFMIVQYVTNYEPKRERVRRKERWRGDGEEMEKE